MKKTTLLLIAIITAISLTSCHKSGAKLFVGDYSFKTSGEISITAEAEIDSSNIFIPAILNVDLSHDIGQLNISTANKKDDQVIVVINYMNGDVVTTTGTCDENTIRLDKFQRNTLPVSVTTLLSNNYRISVSATGRIYDDNMIVFDMTYKGKATVGSVTFNVSDKNIQMVAYRN
jgi:hypothetical protein